MFSEFVYQNDSSLSPELCNRIITLFENDDSKYEGITIGGLQKNVKNTMDLMINPLDVKWIKINKTLENELINNVKIYIDNINSLISSYDVENNNINKFKLFSNKILTTHSKFMIQRYIKNEGKYIYHNDGLVDYTDKRQRVLTFLWYLNDVAEGGETEFLGNKITPTAGKLILFPASWCFPHRGVMPISNNKYIITGWLYVSE